MKKNSCTLFFQYHLKKIENIFDTVLANLQFEPVYMDISQNDISDGCFDVNELKNHLEDELVIIRVKNRINNEFGDLSYIRLFIDKIFFNYFSLTWYFTDLNILLENKSFRRFLFDYSFIYGHCVDYKDTIGEGKIIETHNSISFTPTKVTHWGKLEEAGGLEFIAAPLMWYGKNYESIIPKEKLLRFKYADTIKMDENEIVCIKLFDPNESPALAENRKKQEEFWQFFDLQSVFDNHKKKTHIDFDTRRILIKESEKREKEKKKLKNRKRGSESN